MKRKLMKLLFKKEIKEYDEHIAFLLGEMSELVEMQKLYDDEVNKLTNENKILSLIIESIDLYNKEK